jgi:RNA polymerase sigma factor (sigma-70 family)
MGLVYFVVSKYFFPTSRGEKGKTINSLSYEDLVQEGAIGLSTAIEKFDLEIASEAKSNFGTYAIYWVKAKVLRAIASQDDLIRVPEHVSYSISKIQAASQRLGLDLDFNDMTESGILSISSTRSDPSRERALAVETGLTADQVREALRVASRRKFGGYVSFEPWMQGKSIASASILSDENKVTNGAYQQLMRSDLKVDLAQYLKPKELEAISLRYGLSTDTSRVERDYEAEAEEDLFGFSAMSGETSKRKENRSSIKQGRWGEAMSFQEVGKRMAVSAEYGRQLCSVALKKLRNAAEQGELQLDYIGI